MSNALTTCINLTQAMEIKMGWVVDVTNVFDPFDHEVFLFQKMWSQVVKVIKPCFRF
jgi:hypothetical protein